MAGGASPTVAKDFETLFRVGSAAGLPDGRLLDRFADGTGGVAEAAFAALVERHGPMVLRVCRQVLGDPHDAEDAAQAAFLVLARKARSIRRSDSVASWLHGVAFRVATRAKADAARRRSRERRGAELAARPADGGDPPEAWQELHEELGRLPEKFRLPIMLCHFEGLSHEQAAQRLRCPVRTIQSRLSRGRERLRARLARRGLGPAAGLMAAALIPDAALAAMPGAWTHATSMAAARYAAGGASAAIPEKVAALAGGVLKAMMLKKLKSAATAATLLGVAACGVLVRAHSAPAPATAQPAAPPPPIAPAPPRLAKSADPYRMTTPGGGTIEIVGVSRWPSGPGTWWRPDGTPLAEAPRYERDAERAFPLSGKEGRDVVVGVGFAGGNAAFVLAIRCSAPQGIAFGTWFRLDIPTAAGSIASSGRNLLIFAPNLAMVQDPLPPGREVGTLRFTIASGPWTTRLAVGGRNLTRGTGSIESELGPILFTGPDEAGDRASIVVADGITGDHYTRVVAIDLESKLHHPISPSEAGLKGVTLRNCAFDLRPDRVKEYQFQSRPIEPLEIKGIALRPRRAAP